MSKNNNEIDFKWTDEDRIEFGKIVTKKMFAMFVRRYMPISKTPLTETQKVKILTAKYQRMSDEQLKELEILALGTLFREAMDESDEYEKLPNGKYRFIGD